MVKVYCVLCIDEDDQRSFTHIFSTQEKANEFCESDTQRVHVLYDYVLDCPERAEQRSQ